MFRFTFHLKKRQFINMLIAIFCGIISLFCFASLFKNYHQDCSLRFYSFYFFYYLFGLLQTILQYKIPKMDLFNQITSKRIKKIIAILVFPIILNLFLSTTWWARSDSNPMYCMFHNQMQLPYIFGIVLQIHALIGFATFVGGLINAYTSRKYFLISIGGPQNEVNRQFVQPAILAFQIQLPQPMLNPANYQNFNDNNQHQQQRNIQLKQEIYGNENTKKQCSICLNQLNNTMTSKINCGHIFHSDCIKKWIDNKESNHNSQCPICRFSII